MAWFNVSQTLAWCAQNVPVPVWLCRLVTNVALTGKKSFLSLFLEKCECLPASFTIYSIPEVLYLLLCTEGAHAGGQGWFVCVVSSICFI